MVAASIALGAASCVHADEIKVLAGSAVQPVMNVVIPVFEQKSGNRVDFDFGTVGGMAERVQQGEKADLAVVSAPQMDALLKNGKILPPLERLYRPTDKEPFMSERQREYFRLKLLDWREDILKEAKETLQHLQDESQNHPDLADRASSETDRAIELRARDRQRKLISKIDAALARIEDGTYGYCEETGEPISIKRLEARPIATLSIEAQERHERRERVYRDD